MRRLFVVLVAVLMALSFSLVGFAEEQKAATGSQSTGSQSMMAPEKKMEHTMNFRGEVTAVDTTAKTIVVKGKEGEKTFDVSKATMKGEVKPDYMVHVRYTEENGNMVASSVAVVGTKASKSAKKAVSDQTHQEGKGM